VGRGRREAAGAFLAAGLVDELVVYVAPCWAGRAARRCRRRFAGRAPAFRFECTPIGDDLRLVARLAAAAE
jgi:riboflavin biosynthesis pyrimidine reductase